MAKKKQEVEVSVLETKSMKVDYCILGRTPFIANRMTEKVKTQLLFPSGRMTAAEKAINLKHDPIMEFYEAPHKIHDESAPTLLAHPATAFKIAIASTALDIPGAKKTQMGRLVWVEGEKIPLYGIPKLHMAVTRCADAKRTPDIRTRCIIPEWATKITVEFTVPILKERAVTNLLAAAGQIQGVGDWRPEKGNGTFGQFRVVPPDDPDFVRIMKTGGRAAQEEAMNNPECYDVDTDELFNWFMTEAEERGYTPTRSVA